MMSSNEDPDPVIELFYCNRCKTAKDRSQFYKRPEPERAHNVKKPCKACSNDPEMQAIGKGTGRNKQKACGTSITS